VHDAIVLHGGPFDLRLAVLALGGGTGHLLRALAFARAAAARGHRTRILASSLFTDVILRAIAPSEVNVVRATGSADAQRQLARQWLAAEADDALVVDTFPRGLLGELDGALRTCPRVLVHRDLADAYALRRETREAASTFDAILSPGETGPLAESACAVMTAPWLLAAGAVLVDATTARRFFGASHDAAAESGAGAVPVVVIATTNDDDEARKLLSTGRALAEELRGRVHVAFADLRASDAPLPLARLLAGVDLLVGAGGYHLVHEARATRTPLAALPAHRAYDAQWRRLRPEERAADLTEIASRIRGATPRTTTPPPSIEDGAAHGVRVVEELISRAREHRSTRGSAGPAPHR